MPVPTRMRMPVPYYVRMKFTMRYVYVRLVKGYDRTIISLDTNNMSAQIEDRSSIEATEKLAQVFAAQIKAKDDIPKVHLDVQHEFAKKDEKHHQKILTIADVLYKNGIRIVGYG